MTGKSHFLISACLTQIIGIVVFNDMTMLPAIAGGMAGLLPDIDEDQSTIAYKLVSGLGGSRSMGGINSEYTDRMHNHRIRRIRQAGLTAVLLGMAVIALLVDIKTILYAALGFSIFFSVRRYSRYSIILSVIAILFLMRYMELDWGRLKDYRNYAITISILYMALLPWTSHRKLAHSLVSAVIVGGLLTLGLSGKGFYEAGIYILSGYTLHILEDSLTVKGVPFIYPFSKKNFKIPLMKTNTMTGAVVEGVIIIMCLAAVSLVYAYIGRYIK